MSVLLLSFHTGVNGANFLVQGQRAKKSLRPTLGSCPFQTWCRNPERMACRRRKSWPKQNQGGQQIEEEYRRVSFSSIYATPRASQVGSVVKNPPASAGDASSIPGWRSSPGEENGKQLQYSCLGNLMFRAKHCKDFWHYSQSNEFILPKIKSIISSYTLSACQWYKQCIVE